jgi:hypothetical protein
MWRNAAGSRRSGASADVTRKRREPRGSGLTAAGVRPLSPDLAELGAVRVRHPLPPSG